MHRTLLVAIALSLVLLACFEVPLGKPEAGFADPRLEGLWIEQEEPHGTYETWLIVPFDEHVYCLMLVRFGPDGKRKSAEGAMRGWITTVAGSPFITLEPIQQLLPEYEKPKDYLLARLSFEANGTLGVQLVDHLFEDLEHTHTTAALTRKIEENIHDPRLFKKAQTFRRIDVTVAEEKAIRDQLVGK